MAGPAENIALTEDQAAVYDRQLRVWGVEVQRKLTAARVLLVGFGQLAAEVAKNITLAGVGQVTLLDDTPASQHAGRNFLIPASALSQQTAVEAAAKTLQAMNPLVKIAAAPGSVDSAHAPGLLREHDLVIATGLPLCRLAELGELARGAGVGFAAAGAAGAGGWVFLDLGTHSYAPKGSSSQAGELRVLQYWPMADALGAPGEQLGRGTHPLYFVLRACLELERELERPLAPGDLPAAGHRVASAAEAAGATAQQAGEARQLLEAALGGAGEFAPVCAVLGGVLANNVVAAVSGSGPTLHNLLFFSLSDGRAIVESRPAAAAASAAGGGDAGGSKQQQRREEQQQQRVGEQQGEVLEID